MKKVTLQEELLNQIRLMNFDRSKTLYEQIGMGMAYANAADAEEKAKKGIKNCIEKDYFIDSYPNCCKYKEISVEPPKGKEWINFDENSGLGYCYVDTKIPGVGLNISNQDELIFSTSESQKQMTGQIVTFYVAENFKNYNQQTTKVFLKSDTYKDIDKTISTDDYNESVISSLTYYFSNVVNTYFPIGSVIGIISKEGNTYSASLVFDEISNEFRFDNWYDDQGQSFKMADFKDQRNEYQKFIDEYGVYVQLGVLFATTILTIVTEGAALPLLIEVVAELGIGAALAQRDFEKGDNIMGWVNLLSGGVSALKFLKYFRGVSKVDLDATVNALKNSGLPPNATEEQIIIFLKETAENNPKVANVINKAAKLDDYTMNALKADLASDMTNPNLLKQLKEQIMANPELLGDVKFFERLWVLDLKRQLGFMFVGVALNMTPLADVLNDVEKQKYQWILQNLPENKRKVYDQNGALNPEMQKEILDSSFQKIIEKSKNITPEQKAEMAFQYQQLLIKTDQPLPPDDTKFKSSDFFEKNGYTKITDQELIDLPYNVDVEMDKKGNFWVKNEKNINTEIKNDGLNKSDK